MEESITKLSKSTSSDLSNGGGLNESFSSMQNGHTSQNLASIINMPESKTTQMMGSMRTMITNSYLYKAIEDKSSKLFVRQGIQPNQQPVLSEDTLNRINVDLSEFSLYRSRITNELGQYMKQKRMDAESADLLQTVDLHQVLLRCYEQVPTIFFEEKFQFDFKSQISRKVDQMNGTQEQLTSYLDEVEINLFYQISNRFNEFLKVILDLNNMQKLIDECISKIKFIRTRNLVLKQKLASKGSQIVNLKKRILRCQSVLALLQLVQTLHQSLPSIATLVNAGKFDLAVTLLHQSEIEYNSKFQKMAALNQFRDNIFLYRQKLEKGISTSFNDRALDYVISETSIIKNSSSHAFSSQKQEQPHSQDNSLDESSYMNSTLLNDTFEAANRSNLNLTMLEQISKQSHLSWILPIFRRDYEVEEIISRIVNQSYDLDKFNNQSYRRKLIEMLKGFRNGFLNDMADYANINTNKKQILNDIIGEGSKNQPTEGMFEGMNVELFVKFALFYSDILKRVALKQMGLSQTLLNGLITHVVEKMLEKEEQLDSQIVAFSKLTSTVEDVYANVVQLIKYIDDWMENFLKQRKLDEEISIIHFRRVSKIFQFWTEFQTVDAPQLIKLQSSEFEQINECQKSKELKKFFRKFTDYHLKVVNFKSFETLRSDMERKFLDNFHKTALGKLKVILDSDKWTPADINFEYYEILNYLTTESIQNEKQEAQQECSDKPDESDDDSVLNAVQEDTPKQNENQAEQPIQNNDENNKGGKGIKIIKNLVMINGESYKLSSSFLYLIKQLYEYVHLIEYFQSLRASSIPKLCELLRFYNSYSSKLVIGRGACENGLQITSKHLAISQLCLMFTISALPPIQNKLISIIGSNEQLKETISDSFQRLEEDYQIHSSQIGKTISDILNEEIKKSVSALMESPWNNAKEALRTPTQPTCAVVKSFRLLYSVLLEFYSQKQLLKIYEQPQDNLLKVFLPLFSNVTISNKLGAKRIKDEIEYCVEEIKQLECSKLTPSFIKQFEEQAEDTIQERCMPHLASV